MSNQVVVHIPRDERTGDDQQVNASEAPVIDNPILIAEILSYVLTTTRDFARFRQVCKSWRDEVLPYFLEHHSHHYATSEFSSSYHRPFFFLRICHEQEDAISALPAHKTNVPYRQSLPEISRCPKFLPELVHLANHHRFAGKRYDDLDIWKNIWELNALDFWESVSWCLPPHKRETMSQFQRHEVSQLLYRSKDVSVQSLLIVREAVPSVYRSLPQQQDQEASMNHFASLCKSLVETDSWPQFCIMGEEALNEGMFLSLEDYKTMREEGYFAFESRIVPVIFTVRFCLPPPSHKEDSHDFKSSDEPRSSRQVCFQVRIPKPDGGNAGKDNEANHLGPQVEILCNDGGDAESSAMAPFVKYLSWDTEVRELDTQIMYSHATFMGYNVQPVELGDGAHSNNVKDEEEASRSQYYTCHVPMSFAWWELMQLLVPDMGSSSLENSDDSHGLEDQGADSFLPLDWLRRTCEERSVREGVGIMDGLLDYHKMTKLTKQLDALAAHLDSTTTDTPDFSFRQWQQRRPEATTHHTGGRTALLDPDLYAYSERHSTSTLSVLDMPPCSFWDSHLDPPILQTVDYWGRSYSGAIEYQWLPTYFDVDPDGNCTIVRDYINNLVPRQQFEELYDSLSRLFTLALPLLESVFSYCRVIRRSHVRLVESNQHTWHPLPPAPIKEVPTRLRGQSLQVFAEIEEYDLNQALGEEESWHVKGMPNEEIVATAMYVVPAETQQNHESVGTIQFCRAFFHDEANYLFSAIDRDRPPEVEAQVHTGLLPLGQTDIFPGRLIVFPNCHVSKRSFLSTTDCSTRKLRFVTFYLVNPEKRIMSTREVGTQQGYTVNGSISREQAQRHRIELQEEREHSTPDWNIREVHLL